jgi:mitochondrial chaperone BCS1
MSESDAGLDAKNGKAFTPPTIEDGLALFQHSPPPLDGAMLARLAKQFADSIPNDEFSVAALHGCEFLLSCSKREIPARNH